MAREALVPAKNMKRKEKTIRGIPQEWRDLANVGDVFRMLRYCLLQVDKGRMTIRKANCMGFLGGKMIDAAEKVEFERRLAELEGRQGNHDGGVIHISVSK